MDENINEQIKLHSAGATVRHLSNFDNLKSYKNDSELTKEFISKWVIPFYMEIGNYYDDSWVEAVKQISKEITQDTTLKLLGDFNWRTRLVGAYFSAVKGYKEQIEIIGTHFLKSEVCCVGHIYALVLASYNEEKTLHYLTTYLDFYLQKPELYFDQENVLKTVAFLDKKNNTNNIKRHIENWNNLQKRRKQITKPKIIKTAKNIDIEHTEKQIKILYDLKEYCH